MIDTKELRRLAQAVSEWSNCNQAWLDQSEDVPAATVGHIDEDGNTYPIATIDCDQYYAAHQSLPLAKFYAAANPAVISELLDRLEAAEGDLETERMRLAACGVAALGYFEGCAKKYTSASLDDVLNLRKRLEAAERERDWHAERCEDAMNECAALRSKIEAMEKQGPVAWMHETRRDSDVVTDAVKHVWGKVAVGSMAAYSIPLYAIPGAQTQGEEK